MKKLLFIFVLLLASLSVYAENDVTRFMGIPVDGNKSEMIRQLKAKGFTQSTYNDDTLEGEFNGTNVLVSVVATGDKVSRIVVTDVNDVGETDIRIRFNKLCRQFENNQKYLNLNDDFTIPDDEDISYEINVHDKRYEACFYQKADMTFLEEELKDKVIPAAREKFLQMGIEEDSDVFNQDMMKIAAGYALELSLKKSVWFMISKSYSRYYIRMFYDNEYNRANGEDL